MPYYEWLKANALWNMNYQQLCGRYIFKYEYKPQAMYNDLNTQNL